MSIDPVGRGKAAFDSAGITRGLDGVLSYDDLAPSLIDTLRRRAQHQPDVEALVEVGGERLTYAQLWERAGRVAGGLREAGVGVGDRVSIRNPAGVAWVLAFYGSLLAGAVAVPVNTRFAEREVRYVLDDSGGTYDFAPEAPLPDGEHFAIEGAEPDDPAAIFYTSGTTGAPKGALTTHRAFLSNCENARRCAEIPAEMGATFRTLISVPLFHVTGCNTQLLAALYVGGTAVVLPVLDKAVLLRTITDERINFLVTVPAVYKLLLDDPAFADADTSSVRWVAYGGAPIATAVVHQIIAAFPQAKAYNGFGLTETASLLTMLPHDYAAEHADSVGFAVPVVELAIDGDGSTGELLARGPNITRGYWHKPEATEAAFTDGWLRTGDVARIDDDGLVYILDRAKDMINRGGENVYCVEVENALFEIPGVADAAVVAVPDEVMGEKVGAVVVAAAGTDLDPAQIATALQGQLADFKVPQFVSVRTEPLPRNPGGKLLKKQIRTDTSWGAPLR
ncbi:MAG: AMP-binding protein [Mycobacteriaceae bacterium]